MDLITIVLPLPTINKEDTSENSANEAKDTSENKVVTAEEKSASVTNEKSPKETSAAESNEKVRITTKNFVRRVVDRGTLPKNSYNLSTTYD